VLGLSKKEIDEKIDEIIDFAEIGEFIDSPVQNYSSGMSVRLGFSIASSLSPDVLILDEVLAVGDIGFVIKCLNRVRQLTSDAAVIFVSHQMQFISQFCSRVLLMDHGHVALETAEPQLAVNRYFMLAKAESKPSGTGGVEMHGVRFAGQAVSISGDEVLLQQGLEAILELDFSVNEDDEPASLHVTIADQSESAVIIYLLIGGSGEKLAYSRGRHKATLDLGRIELNSGRYSLQIGAEGRETGRIFCLQRAISPFAVRAGHNHWAKLVRHVVPREREEARSIKQRP
jgi:lipopolysaccharide transport system ATP-binding protein